jgi:predicted lipoprotein with Yx(FWY)xxD motif
MAGIHRRTQPARGTAALSLAAAAVLVAACGSSGGNSGSSHNAAASTTVSARQIHGIGSALVTGSGMTIYTPKSPAEVNGNIKCTGPCLSFWLPVTGSSASTHSSRLPGKLGTIHLPGGKTQLTYNGRPLYTFRLDTAAGQAHGNNFTDSFNGIRFTWEAVTASGEPAAADPAAPAPSSGSGYGSGY